MLCWGESRLRCTIHPVNLQCLKWICTKRSKCEAEPEVCSGARTCSRCAKSVVSISLRVHLNSCGYFIGVVQLAAVLFWSCGKAWEDVCCVVSMLPSQKAEAYLGPASARSGETDLACPLGMGFLLIPPFSPWESHPSCTLCSLKARQTESKQPVTLLLLEKLVSGIWI